MHTLSRASGTIVLTPQIHQNTLVWLHGLGDSAEGFAPLFQQHSDILPNCKYVLLTAPTRAVTLNMGMRMTSWYDIRTLGAREMNEEVLDSAEIISRVLQEESKSCENVYLGGFSQGAAMTLFTGLHHYQGRLKGLAALSGYAFEFDIPEDRRSIPTFLYNGEMDDLVKFDMANRSFDLTLQGVNVTKHSEPRMGHEVSEREIQTMKQWFHSIASS